MRSILIQRHSNGLNNALTTWKGIHHKPAKKTSSFYDYAEKRNIEIEDVSKNKSKISKQRWN